MEKIDKIPWKERALAAERTVEILCDKVEGLLNGSQNIVQKQLERARQREEKNERRRAVMETRAAALEKYSHQLENEVRERTAELRAILDNVAFGFLLVGRDYKVLKGYTESCYKLIGTKSIDGRDIGELLGLSERKASSYIAGLMQMLEDMLPEEVLVDQVQQRFEVQGRVLQIEPSIVRDSEGNADKLLMSINDITSLEAAQKEAKKNTLLVEVLRCKEAFLRFLRDSKSGVSEAVSSIEDQELVRRILHTIKGNCATYDLDCLVEYIHELEENDVIEAPAVRKVSSLITDFLRANESVLEVDFNDIENAKFEVSQERFDELRGLSGAANPRAIQAWAAVNSLRPAHAVLGPVENFVYKLAHRLDKNLEFETRGLSTPIDEKVMGPVLGVLPHLLRNAVDHGLENPEDRGAKATVGRVSLVLSETGDEWHITVSDDGRGIDVQGVVERAIELGKATNSQVSKLGASEKVKLVFLDGVSSRTEVTDISGRGVGATAVLAEARRAGGNVDVESTVGQGTRFQIRIPKPEILIQEFAKAS